MIEVLTVLLAHDPSVTIPCTCAVEAVVVTRCAARTGAGKAGGRGARAEEVGEGGAGRGAGGGKGKGGSKGRAIHPVGLLVKPKGRLLQEAFMGGGRTRRAHALREMARKYLPLRSYYSSVLVTAIAGLCVGLLNVPLSLLARRGWGSKAVAFTTAASVTAALALYWQAILGYAASSQFLARMTEGNVHLALSEFRAYGVTGVECLLAVYGIVTLALTRAAWKMLGGRAALRLAPVLMLPVLTGLWLIRLGLAVA